MVVLLARSQREHNMHEITADEHVSAYWSMCDDAEVQDLTKQLADGLIHPLEYADKVKRIATDKYSIA